MEPALREAIFAIHLAETKHVSFNTIPPKIKTLSELQCILSSDRRPSQPRILKEHTREG